MNISEEDLKYIIEHDLDQSEIRLNKCKCGTHTLLFKSGYTGKAKKIKWVDRAGYRYDYGVCKECKRGRNRERNRETRRKKSSEVS